MSLSRPAARREHFALPEDPSAHPGDVQKDRVDVVGRGRRSGPLRGAPLTFTTNCRTKKGQRARTVQPRVRPALLLKDCRRHRGRSRPFQPRPGTLGQPQPRATRPPRLYRECQQSRAPAAPRCPLSKEPQHRPHHHPRGPAALRPQPAGSAQIGCRRPPISPPAGPRVSPSSG